MTNFVWFPVTGDGQTAATPYVWNGGTFQFTSGADWVNIDLLQNPYLMGVVPGSGGANGSNISNGATDAAFLVAGSAPTSLLNLLYKPNLANGKPYIQFGPGSTTFFPVDVQLASGSVTLATLGLGQPASFSSPTLPILEITGASLTITGNVLDSFTETFPQPFGTQTAARGGTIDLSAGAHFEVGGTVGTAAIAPDVFIDFKDTAADMLTLDGVSSSTPSAFAGQIQGFGVSNVIDLTGVPFAASPTASYDPVKQILTLSNGATTYATLSVAGAYTTTSFSLRPDAGTGTEIVTCFAAGTRILTEHGEQAVEALSIGDRVVLAGNRGTAPIRWIGVRHINCARHKNPKQVQPVRIRANAFAVSQPKRDLFLSPDHAIYAEGVLIPVKYLQNGTSVAQLSVASATYYHIELPQHDVVLAEGLAVESLLPSEDHSSFDNADHGRVTLHPDFNPVAWEADGCAPLVVLGPKLEATRAILAARMCAAEAAAA